MIGPCNALAKHYMSPECISKCFADAHNALWDPAMHWQCITGPCNALPMQYVGPEYIIGSYNALATHREPLKCISNASHGHVMHYGPRQCILECI